MKKIILICLMSVGILTAQFKSQSAQISVFRSQVKPASLSFFQSLIDPSRIEMRQQYNLSISSFGNETISLGQYTNSMFYNFAPNLNARMDVTLQHSPYNSLGKNGDALNGIFLSRAEINYQPFDNMVMRLSYQKVPSMYNRNYFGNSNNDYFNNW